MTAKIKTSSGKSVKKSPESLPTMADNSPNLLRVQQEMAALWTNRKRRKEFSKSEKNNAQFLAGVKVYSRLIELGRLDLMTSIYPIIHTLLPDEFENLVFDYFELMPPAHFNFNRAAENFAEFFSLHRPDLIKEFPFLPELAHYEWTELAVVEADIDDYEAAETSVADGSEAFDGGDEAARFAAAVPVVNRAVKLCRYRYNIPEIALAIKEGDPIPQTVYKPESDPFCVIIYRDPETYIARFLEVGSTALGLIEYLLNNPNTNYGQLILAMCSSVLAENAQTTLTGCLEAIEQFKNFGLILAEI